MLIFIAPIALVLILVIGGTLYFIPAIHNRLLPNAATITIMLNATRQPV